MIPARNEEHYLPACLDSLLCQSHRELEILVVDGESTDGTRQVVESYCKADNRVRLLRNPGRIVPTGLNIALEQARSKWLVRVDAHATVPPDYVERAVAHLRSGNWGAVGGRKDGIGVTPAGRAIATAMASPFGVGGSTYHHGSVARTVEHVPFGCYPVSLLRELGGWDERLVVNQDFELDWRVREAGHELLFDPSLRIEWVCRQTLRDLFLQYRRYGRGKAKVARLHPRSLRPRHLLPPLLVLWFGCAAVVSARSPRLAASMVAPYGIGLIAATTREGKKLDAAARLRLPGAFAAMHVAWGVGFWSGLPDALRDGRARRNRTARQST